MNARRFLLSILAISVWTLAACNWTIGDCYPVEERSSGVGAGPGYDPVPVFTSASSGDFGAEPPDGPNDGSERKIACNKWELEHEHEEESPRDSSERPTESTTSPQDPCPEFGDIAGDGATVLSCSDACSSKCPPPGMAPWIYVNFEPSDFMFVVITDDDATGGGAGWQEAKAKLNFKRLTVPHKAKSWSCAFTIGMPLRTEIYGRIDADRAASLSEEATEEVANRMDYDLPQGIFCSRFIEQTRATFKSKYKGLGARVKNP
ncbi:MULTISPECIES: hypothetical protein [Sorangium]|uniref:Secreted protein n=1 Tax=Sorangium cellulosum TaxID=56 RepID=A0A4P2R2N7_SORCE|nr:MULTISPECIES: hypothetical protein [Sorangium]AUX37284.1 hypothetical protein SOCE836_095060 [Sorangium cellulosum]WCQ96573.1 hypothetical protein NQZ70_09360 [Sorangium sp. Soce836]